MIVLVRTPEPADATGMRTRIAVTALSVLAGVALAGQATASPVGDLQWRPCPSDQAPTKECAELTVPRRYDRPGGPSITVALARIPATGDPQTKIGSLVWDAGGPGGPSTDMVDRMTSLMSPDIRARFDFVAFDPRGIGSSTPALKDCGQPWPVRPARDPNPDWRSVQKASAKVLTQANRACLNRNRRLASVMGTNNVARDLDRIRAALGDERLTFWGTSYGTRIGYVYALRFPQRVRAMVMDGNIDPSHGYRGLARVGGLSQDQALRFIKREAPAIHRSAVRTAASLTTAPITLDGGSRFTRWDWLDIVGDVVAFQDSWQILPQYAQLVDTARGKGARATSARLTLERTKQRPNSNEGAGFSVVNCLDYADRLSPRQQADLATANAKRGPINGGSLTLSYAMGCSGLGELAPDPVPLVTTAKQRARLAEVPVLLANATHDGSTPMLWATRMQKVFDRPMVRYRGTQHVIWGATSSTCVNAPIDRFVLSLRLPAKNRTCAFVAPQPSKKLQAWPPTPLPR